MTTALFLHETALAASYTFLGCFKDTSAYPGSDNPTQRLLPYRLASNDMTMTSLVCSVLAEKAGFAYFATQHMNWCYGSNDLSLAMSLGTAAADQCIFPCSGNVTEVCGEKRELLFEHCLVIEDPHKQS